MELSGEYLQSREDLEQHLRDTVQALELSARAFDEGHEGESKRLAAAIRVLVHDTQSSKSLLSQLGRKNMQFYDTALPRPPMTIMTYNGITAMNIRPQGATYVAPLDNLPPGSPAEFVSFDEWWNKVIFLDKSGRETTRKDLILAVANKDGGAHVDPVLDEKYAALSRLNSLAWQYHGPRGEVPLQGPEKAAVRQITHEVLKTFQPGLASMKPAVNGALFMGACLSVHDNQPQVAKVGRNQPCPCGSGKKYKRCHGST